jgi:hypothetical protein
MKRHRLFSFVNRSNSDFVPAPIAHAMLYGAAVFAVALTLPSSLRGQDAPAKSLTELKERVKIGELLSVTDSSGREVKGRLLDISTDALKLDLRAGPRTYAEHEIGLVQRPDTLWKGALIGAAVGGGIAIVDYSIDPSEPKNAVISVCLIGVGAAVGAGIDALIGGPRTLFVRFGERRAARFSVLPFVSPNGQGVTVSARF